MPKKPASAKSSRARTGRASSTPRSRPKRRQAPPLFEEAEETEAQFVARMPKPWGKVREPPPYAFIVQAKTYEERCYLFGSYKPKPHAPQSFADDLHFIQTGSMFPETYREGDIDVPISKLVERLVLAETPMTSIVQILRSKRAGYGKMHVVCAEFITEEMVRHEFAYEIEHYPYEAAGRVAAAVYDAAMAGSPKAQEMIAAMKMPWTEHKGAPPSEKAPWQVTGTLRIARDEAVESGGSQSSEDA